ncbi:MAG: hypothetical protein IKU75_13460 [Butyricimonas sp.]|nr:hypothetical protein [Butyricimonas sp.]
MPIVTSQYWNIVYGREEGQAALDTEGMQTIRTMANNMAWLLKMREQTKDTLAAPETETKIMTNFIR